LQISNSVVDYLLILLPSLSVIVACGLVLWGSHWFLIAKQPDLGNEKKFPRQIIMLALTIVSILAIVIALPITDSSRSQIIGLIGILLSGIIAFSSTNVIGNLMAGVLLRITKPFRTGDFIHAGEFFGRVSERGLFDTEIQSESRELISLPNSYLVSNPVTTTRSSGAIVSATLSLGYDVHHLQVEPLLIKAAEESGLTDAFVQILELGDFSVTYRISALLTDVKGLLTARSNLFRAVLNTLHADGIEIASPTYMNQRQLSNENKVIPTFIQTAPEKEVVVAEEMVFDKAEMAEKIEGQKATISKDIEEMEAALKESTGANRGQLKEKIEKKRKHLKTVEKVEAASKIETPPQPPPSSPA